MFDVSPPVTPGSDFPGVRALRRATFAPSLRAATAFTQPGPARTDDRPRRTLAWTDLPIGDGRLSEVRRRLRVLQVERVASGRGLAA
jgi:hypothetical protein